MPPADDALARLLRRSRRRAWANRCADAVHPAVIAGGLAVIAAGLLHAPAAWPASAVFGLVLAARAGRPTSLAVTAGRLDARYATDDLLHTAWQTPAADPWTAAVRAAADARARTLAPDAPPRKVSVRRHACGLAAVVAVVVATRLPSAGPTASPVAIAASSAAGPVVRTAADPLPPADTAASATPPAAVPADAVTATNAAVRRSHDGADASGEGRADAGPTPLPSEIRSGPIPPAPTPPGRSAGGTGAAVRGAGASKANGSTVVPSPPADPPVTATPADGRSAVGTGPAGLADTSAYRDLVRDFFAR